MNAPELELTRNPLHLSWSQGPIQPLPLPPPQPPPLDDNDADLLGTVEDYQRVLWPLLRLVACALFGALFGGAYMALYAFLSDKFIYRIHSAGWLDEPTAMYFIEEAALQLQADGSVLSVTASSAIGEVELNLWWNWLLYKVHISVLVAAWLFTIGFFLHGAVLTSNKCAVALCVGSGVLGLVLVMPTIMLVGKYYSLVAAKVLMVVGVLLAGVQFGWKMLGLKGAKQLLKTCLKFALLPLVYFQVMYWFSIAKVISSGSEREKALWGIVWPLITAVCMSVARLPMSDFFSRKRINLRPGRRWGLFGVFLPYRYSFAIISRFLIRGQASFGGMLTVVVAQAIVELGVRACSVRVSRLFLRHVLRQGPEQIEKNLTSERARQLRAIIGISNMVSEYMAIFITPLIVFALHRMRFTVDLGISQDGSIDLRLLLGSTAVQLAAEVLTDLGSMRMEEDRDHNPMAAGIRSRAFTVNSICSIFLSLLCFFPMFVRPVPPECTPRTQYDYAAQPGQAAGPSCCSCVEDGGRCVLDFEIQTMLCADLAKALAGGNFSLAPDVGFAYGEDVVRTAAQHGCVALPPST